MNRTAEQQRPNTAHIHPRVFHGVVALACIYMLSTWYGFAAGKYTDYLLFVVTGFVLLSIGLPLLAWRVRQRHKSDWQYPQALKDFEEWAESEVDVTGTRMKGWVVAVEILLPLAAIAFGMLGFALVAHLA